MTTCPPDTPQKNGMAERVWLELVPMAKCLLANVPGDCPPNFWSYAVKFACMILNRIPSAKLLNKSSYELVEELTGKNIAISHLELHRFGAAAHIVLPKPTRDPTTGEVATYAVYLGVSEVNLAALFWRPDTGRISESIHFKLSGEYTNIFVTDPQGDSKLHRYKKPLKSGHKGVPAVTGFGSFPLIPELANPICISEDIATNSEFFDAESGNADSSLTDTILKTQAYAHDEANEFSENHEREPSCVAMAAIRDSAFIDALALDKSHSTSAEPTTLSQAELLPDAHLWKEAWLAEAENLKVTSLKGPFLISEIPSNSVIINSKLVFKKKTDGRHKCRMVLRGDTQPEHPVPPSGIKETLYSPTIRLAIVRMFLALMCTIGMFINSIDVKSAFCQTPLPADYPPTYVRFPKGTTENLLGQLYLLICSLYGLIDAPRLFYLFWISILSRLRFVQSRIDPCLWIRDQGTPNEVLLLFWVDDSLTATKSQKIFEDFFLEISQIIEVTCSKSTDPDFVFIGLTINYNMATRTVKLTQARFINTALQRFGLSDANATLIPLPADTRIEPAAPEDILPLAQIRIMQGMVGTLIYLEQATRFDLAFAVGQIARVMGAPNKFHMGFVKQIYRYLIGTKTMGITYGPPKSQVTTSGV